MQLKLLVGFAICSFSLPALAQPQTCRSPVFDFNPQAVENGVWFEASEAERVLFLLNCVPKLNEGLSTAEKLVNEQRDLVQNLDLQIATATTAQAREHARANEWRDLYREETRGQKVERTVRDVLFFVGGAAAVALGAWAVTQ